VVETNEDILTIETPVRLEKIKQLSNRLSFTFHVNEFIFSCKPSLELVKQNAKDNPLKTKGSIAVRYRNRSNKIDSQPIVKALAEIYTKERSVELEKPDSEIRALITDGDLYVGVKIAEINRMQFEKRKVQHRPFFSPISLHPKLARCLINLSGVKKNETLLDPFCGTGGFLIEAGLIGARAIGSDIEDKMIEGCKKTLDFYKIKNYELYCSDIGDIKQHVGKVDAVVTDLPYGKSTTTKGEDIKQLYERAFQNISEVLKEHGRAVIGLSDKSLLPIGEQYFSLMEKHEFKVHHSLTRYFPVFEK
jgi:tRNA (guanine10-N2)-dimethyltransferase